MGNVVKYENWPPLVKIVTALSNKKFYFKQYKLSLFLGYLIIALIVIVLLVALFFYPNEITSADSIQFICFGFIGLVNVAAGYALKWILQNSSWDERFENKSSTLHKVLNVLVSVLVIACLFGYFFYK